jgi:hypothetical protein
MVKLIYKIKAFSILEVMISLVIIMIVFGFSSVLIVNMGGINKEKQDAYAIVNSIRNQTIRESRFIDESLEIENFIIEKTILDHPEGSELKILLIEAFLNKERLIENRELILINTLNP